MIDRTALASGLHALGAIYGREIKPDMLEVYASVLDAHMTTEEFQKGVQRALSEEKWFPAPATLIRLGCRQTVPSVAAAQVYAEILDSYESGVPINRKAIEEKYGKAAADAFMTAGGSVAFEWCDPGDRPFRLKRFVEAFSEVAARDPVALLPAGETKLLK